MASENDQPRVLIGGTRTFADRAFLFRTMDRLTRRLAKPVVLTGAGYYWLTIDGKAQKVGADLFGEEWACSHYYPLLRFHPDFDSHKAPEVFLIRNREMVEELSRHRQKYGAFFWDCVSPGTKFTIDLCRKAGVKVEVIRVQCPPIPHHPPTRAHRNGPRLVG
jgi:hypothetical protein